LIKAVIFDFDGLLVDSEPIYVKANKKFLSERGITDFSIINRIFGMRAEETFELMKKEFNLDGSIEELMNIRNRYIIDDFKNGELKLMPYMIETLEELNKTYPLAIGSSSKKVLIDTAMEIYQFSHYFKDLVCGDDAKKGKPDPEIYLKNAVNLKIDPSKCVVLEDSPNGILAGKRAGMKTIAIPNEQTKDLDFSHADFVLSNLKEAISIIKNI
jgi:HAD superfamily hydrolase (TIGR01509 family)